MSVAHRDDAPVPVLLRTRSARFLRSNGGENAARPHGDGPDASSHGDAYGIPHAYGRADPYPGPHGYACACGYP